MSVDHDQAVEAMGPHQAISQAVNHLVAKHHVTEAAAFEMLVHGSSVSQDQVRDEAAQVLRESHC